MRLKLALAALAAIALALALWRPWGSAAPRALAPAEARSTFDRLGDLGEPEGVGAQGDAGSAPLRLRVIDGSGAPLAFAPVRLKALHVHNVLTEECSICQQPLLVCGEPATFQEVVAALRAGRGGLRELGAQVSDAQGRVQFDGVPSGLEGLRVEVRHPTRGQRSFQVDPAVGLDDAPEVVLTFGADLRAVRRVVDEADRPVPGAVITLVDQQTLEISTLRADSAGQFTLTAPGGDGPERDPAPVRALVEAPGLQPALVLLDADPEGEQTIRLERTHTLVVLTRVGGKPVEATVTLTPFLGHPRVLVAHGGEARFVGTSGAARALLAEAGAQVAILEQVEVPEGDAPLELELRAGARLLLTALDAQGAPLGDAQVALYASAGSSSNAVTAKDTGLAVLGLLPEGEYVLSVQHLGLIPVERRVDLGPGDTALELTLDEGLRVSGVVVDAQGRPVEDARVGVEDDEGQVDPQRSGADGRFTLQVPRPGPFVIFASSDEHGEASATTEAPRGELLLRLDPLGSVTVEVKGVPPGVELDVFALGGRDPLRRTATADPQVPGAWLLKGLAAGEWEVRAQAEALLPVLARVTLAEHEHQRVTLTAVPGWFLSGSVLTEDGAPVSEGIIFAEPGGDGAGLEDGGFRLGPLNPREGVTLELHGSDCTLEPVAVPPGTQALTLRARSFPRVRGRVVDPRGQPVRSFMVLSTQVDDPQGRFSIPAKREDGAVRLTLSAPRYVTRIDSFPAADDLGDLVLRPVEKVSGRVLGPTGTPVSAATVTCERCNGAAVSGSDGHFTLELEREEGDRGSIGVDGHRGAQVGHLDWDPGTPLELRLVAGVRVTGQVLGPDGKGRRDLVLIAPEAEVSSFDQRRVDTAADGTFQLELPAGPANFEARSSGATLRTLIAAPATHVLLGPRPGSCAVRIGGGAQRAVLIPEQPDRRAEELSLEDAAKPGTVILGARGGRGVLEASGVPCGRYKAFYGEDEREQGQLVDLRGALTQLQAPPPTREPDPASDAGQ